MEMEELQKEREILTGKLFVARKLLSELEQQTDIKQMERHRFSDELSGIRKLIETTADDNLRNEMHRRNEELQKLLENSASEIDSLRAEMKKNQADLHDAERQLAMIEKSMALNAELQKNLSQIDSYESVDKVNQDEFSELVQAAIGNRSMRQFANDIGYNVSSISRIINKKLRGACSDEMLAAIASNAAEGSGVTVEKLMNALGKKKIVPGVEFEERGKRIIRNELLDRGYFIADTESEYMAGPGFRFRFDYSIRTDAATGKEGRWVFDFKSATSGKIGNEYVVPVGFGRTRQILAMITSMLYCGTLNADKVSICLDRRSAFDHVVENLKGIKVKNNLSIILIAGGRVADEYIIPLQDGDTPESIFKKAGPVKKNIKENEDIEWDDSLFEEGH